VKKVYDALFGTSGQGLTLTQKAIALAILASTVTVVIATEPNIGGSARDILFALELGFAGLFLTEYVLRIWSVGVDSRYVGVRGRLRYAVTLPALIDLAALLPFLIGLAGSESLMLRLVRLLRLLMLGKLARYSMAFAVLSHAVSARRHELLVSGAIALLVLLVASTMLYVFEGMGQPEAFGSIPRALWWGVTTLTTVGYGDVVPQTPMGRIFGALTAIGGIGLIAMPTGILAGAISDAIKASRDRNLTASEKRE
jgi:voltage-gated potassium channel